MKKKLLVISIIILSASMFNLYSQEPNRGVNELKFKLSDGSTISLKRVNYGFLSLIPLPMEKNAIQMKAKGNKSILFPIVFKKDFSILMTAQLVRNAKYVPLKEFFMNEVSGKKKQPEWDMKTVHTFNKKSLSLGNAGSGISITGIDSSRLPMKTYNMFVILQNRDKDKFIKLYGIISVNPGHVNYNNYKEIYHYLIDLRYSMLSVRFEE